MPNPKLSIYINLLNNYTPLFSLDISDSTKTLKCILCYVVF